MKYTTKQKGRIIEVKGNYIPKGFTCLCKSCNFTIEVPIETSEQEIKELIEKLKAL